MMRTITTLFFALCLLTLCSGCISILRYDGPYEGCVIDAESGKPIEGAVAHGTWSKVHPTPAGRSTEYLDSYEVLTDKDGNFKIPGKGLLVFSNIDVITLTIFKAGYTQWEPHSWLGLQNWNNWSGDDRLTWDEAGKGTFKMKKMTLEERRKRVITFPYGPNKTKKLMLRENNRENIEIGRSASTLAPEE